MKKTSEVTHTRGPWAWVGAFNPVVERADRTFRICEMLNHAPEDYANARLIAAAPELLDACKGGLVALEELAVIANSWYPDTYSQISKARDIARAAIAKATGSATATLAPLKEQL